MTTGVSAEHIAKRIERELAHVERIWIAPELTSLRARIEAERQTSENVDVAVIEVDELDETGCACGPRTPPRAARILGVLRSPLRIVKSGLATTRPGPTTFIARAFCPLGVLEVQEHGLVILELAQGVSAIDLQRHAEPTLKISSHVTVMRDNVASVDR